MNKKFWYLISALLIAAMVLSACGGGGATTAPTTAPVVEPTQAPAVTQAPAMTEAPTEAAAMTEAPTTAPAMTEAPTTGPAAAGPALSGQLTLWHAYHTGGSEEQALTQILDGIRQANPDLTVDVLAIPFDQVFNKWETEVAAGGGPDLFIAPNDNLGKEVRASLVQPLDDMMAGKTDQYVPVAIQGMTVDGKLYAVPESLKAVALYYNKDTVPTPPTTTDELLQLVKDGKKLVLNQNAYHNFGFWGAFGGKLVDDAGKCTADQGGFADAMQYLLDLKNAGKANSWDVFQTDGAKADSLFRQGQADMIINGPWVLGDYSTDLGDKLGVVPMPAGPGGPATPLTAPDGFYINPNSANQQLAVDLASAITSKENETIYTEKAGHVPSRPDVTISDPLVQGFADASATGYARPQTTWFDNYWTPFGDLITKVLEGQVAPADGVKEACDAMNKANNMQ